MRILATGKIEMGEIATVMGRQIVINRFPEIVKGKIVGVVSVLKKSLIFKKWSLNLERCYIKWTRSKTVVLSDIVGRSSELVKAKNLAQKLSN